MKRSLFCTTLLTLIYSCDKKIKSKQGTIDVITNVYFNASKNLNNFKTFHIASIAYLDSNIIEFTPNLENHEAIDSVYYIKNKTYYHVGNTNDAKTFLFKEKHITKKFQPIANKKAGINWINIKIKNYDKRKNLKDTILYENKNFTRFQITDKNIYTIFYINKTDTIIPYSFNSIVEKDYKGRIERIDSYDKKKDIFNTIILISTYTLNKQAKEIFDYNKEIEEKYQIPTK